MNRLFTYILTLTILTGTAASQDNDSDSTRIDTVSSDTLPVVDSIPADTLPDFMEIDPVTGDTIITGEANRFRMEERMKEFQLAQIKRPPRLSFFDSLTTYFTSPRLNQRDALGRSMYKNAGDFFKFDPSFFSLDYQTTPMRTTVAPFGLSGNRLHVVAFGDTRQPFEHVIEPDGQIDLNDIPTAQATDMYILPGATGQLFGSPSSVATLVTTPRKVETGPARSAFIVDQGSFAYNHLRGRFAKRFESHREIDLAIGYRNADGSAVNRDDDTKHYLGRIFEPVGETFGINADIWLYDRSSHSPETAAVPSIATATNGRPPSPGNGSPIAPASAGNSAIPGGARGARSPASTQPISTSRPTVPLRRTSDGSAIISSLSMPPPTLPDSTSAAPSTTGPGSTARSG